MHNNSSFSLWVHIHCISIYMVKQRLVFFSKPKVLRTPPFILFVHFIKTKDPDYVIFHFCYHQRGATEIKKNIEEIKKNIIVSGEKIKLVLTSFICCLRSCIWKPVSKHLFISEDNTRARNLKRSNNRKFEMHIQKPCSLLLPYPSHLACK